jgi:ATP-dependent Clp protease ATP-binding subunit ClpC
MHLAGIFESGTRLVWPVVECHPVFEKFTDKARRVLLLAEEEARLVRHNFIGTEHLLLGLIHEERGVAAKALAAHGIELEAVRQIVVQTVGSSFSEPVGSPPFTPRARRVLELSMRESNQLGHNYIATQHILLGLVREGQVWPFGFWSPSEWNSLRCARRFSS